MNAADPPGTRRLPAAGVSIFSKGKWSRRLFHFHIAAALAVAPCGERLEIGHTTGFALVCEDTTAEMERFQSFGKINLVGILGSTHPVVDAKCHEAGFPKAVAFWQEPACLSAGRDQLADDSCGMYIYLE